MRTSAKVVVRIRAGEGLPTALERLLVYAVDHVDAASCRIAIQIQRKDDVSLIVETSERCISSHAITALTRAEETALVHGEGVALWLLDWVVTRTGETVQLISGEDGTRLEVELPPDEQ